MLTSGKDEILSGGGSEREQRLQAVFDAMSEGFVLCEAIRDAEGVLVDYWLREANNAFRRGSAEPMTGRRVREVFPDIPDEWMTTCHKVLETGRQGRIEYFSVELQRWYEAHITKVADNELAQFFVDVTARKRVEERQRALFDELNHRVKNNLTIISGLLAIQARTAAPEVRDQLSKAVDRIQTVADIHASLYQYGSLERVDFPAYLASLCERLSRSLGDDGRVQVVAAAEPSEVSLDQAVPLGVIINELVTNAVKHAYPAPAAGEVSVRFEARPTGWVLRVADRGPGMAEDVEARGLGMRVIRSLTQQLGGTLRIRREGGTTFVIRLPAAFAAVRPADSA